MPVRALRLILSAAENSCGGRLKTMNAREGIKTKLLLRSFVLSGRLLLKTMNAREGIKTLLRIKPE